MPAHLGGHMGPMRIISWVCQTLQVLTRSSYKLNQPSCFVMQRCDFWKFACYFEIQLDPGCGLCLHLLVKATGKTNFIAWFAELESVHFDAWEFQRQTYQAFGYTYTWPFFFIGSKLHSRPQACLLATSEVNTVFFFRQRQKPNTQVSNGRQHGGRAAGATALERLVADGHGPTKVLNITL